MYWTGNYRVIDVDQDCVRMSKFIETKLKCQYEDGKAFYEVTENDSEEDLLYCKKILRPQTNKVFSYSYNIIVQTYDKHAILDCLREAT